MSSLPIAAPAALKNDFSDLIALLDDLTSATNDLTLLEAGLNASHLANVRSFADQYKALQKRIGEAKAAIEVISARNPQWFDDKKTLETPFGGVKRTTSTSLEVPDETLAIALIRAAGRADDFLVTTTAIRLETLETLGDEDLAKFGVRRETKHNFKPEPAAVDLGKAVKAAEKTPAGVARAARNARSS